MRMPTRGVLFDFAGTLFVPEPESVWVRNALVRLGVSPEAHQVDELAAAMIAAGRPGGPEPRWIPPEQLETYRVRDRSSEAHRAAYVALLETVPSSVPGLATVLYERGLEADAWLPYPDTRPTLEALRSHGVRVAVVSNIAWDLRRQFRPHGLVELVDAFVLSHELGVEKPDPLLFTTACRELGISPAEALMVGDSAGSDGGAVRQGIPSLLLPMTPPGEPHGLDAVLSLVLGARSRPSEGGELQDRVVSGGAGGK